MSGCSNRYDAIVLGTGAAGMAAAAVAATEGLRVLLVEKTTWVGGTTAISGGMVWMPANAKMAAIGLPDSLDNARLYLNATVPSRVGKERRETFLREGAQALAYLETNTAVRLKPVSHYPDYYPELPGATAGGRVLEPVPFDARRLGDHFARLRAPLGEFMLFGGMMVARTDIPHFRKVLRSVRSTVRVASLVGRYGLERLRAQRGTTLHLGNALAAQLFRSVLDKKVDLILDTSDVVLLHDGRRISGISLVSNGQRQAFEAGRGVVLATGGFSHSATLRKNYLPTLATQFSPACAGNTGDGAEMAIAAGARFVSNPTDNAFWIPVSRFTRKDGSEGIFPHTVTDRAKPGVIAIDQSGRRFANEAVSYHEFVRAMFRAGVGRAYLVCDSKFLWKYGLGAVKPFDFFYRRHVSSGYLKQARSIRDLGSLLRVDAERFASTVSCFNASARLGIDPEFGRGSDIYQRHLGDPERLPNPCVAPVEQAPFYAIAIEPTDAGTAAGIATNEHAQVVDGEGQPIEGLFACGNDMWSIMEGAYPGPGITLGPALTFGYIVGRGLAATPASHSRTSAGGGAHLTCTVPQ